MDEVIGVLGTLLFGLGLAFAAYSVADARYRRV